MLYFWRNKFRQAMSVQLNIEYDQLLELAKQLPKEQIKQLIEDLGEMEEKDQTNSSNVTSVTNGIEKKEDVEHTDFQKFLLQFSHMVATEEELENYKNIRKELNQWGKK